MWLVVCVWALPNVLIGTIVLRASVATKKALAPSRRAPRGQVNSHAPSLSRPLRYAIVAFFNLAKRGAKLRTARKITTYVAILSSHPCDGAARRILQRAVRHRAFHAIVAVTRLRQQRLNRL
jgi:hypothetical protein